MYMGDRWNAAGPGSVAQASYVWLPLLPVPAPSRHSLHVAPMQPPLDSRRVSNLTRLPQLPIIPMAPGPQRQVDHAKLGDAAVEADDERNLGLVMQSPGVDDGFWRRHISSLISLMVAQSAHWAWEMRAAAEQAEARLEQHVCNLLARAGSMCRLDRPCSNTETFTLVFRHSWRLQDFLSLSSPIQAQKSLGQALVGG